MRINFGKQLDHVVFTWDMPIFYIPSVVLTLQLYDILIERIVSTRPNEDPQHLPLEGEYPSNPNRNKDIVPYYHTNMY
jgi:hypothetical protein